MWCETPFRDRRLAKEDPRLQQEPSFAMQPVRSNWSMNIVRRFDIWINVQSTDMEASERESYQWVKEWNKNQDPHIADQRHGPGVMEVVGELITCHLCHGDLGSSQGSAAGDACTQRDAQAEGH